MRDENPLSASQDLASPVLASPAAVLLPSLSPTMRELECAITDIGRAGLPVLLVGEKGTGKEIVAREIHQHHGGAGAPFLKVRCAEQDAHFFRELFEETARAAREMPGRASTVFLDEIAELTPATQVKLLRVLQEREALPVGATEPIPVDVRVIAATNRDLEEEMRRGGFRSDLYYRLNVISLRLPPLRERPDDIPVLVEHFLQRLAGQRDQPARRLEAAVMEAIQAYDWPGNVRELENALEHAVTLSRSETIDVSALPERVTSPNRPLVQERTWGNPTLDTIERAYILWILQTEGGNKTRAAEVLGIDPSTLYRKLGRYDSGPA